jgi:hypothetical protein
VAGRACLRATTAWPTAAQRRPTVDVSLVSPCGLEALRPGLAACVRQRAPRARAVIIRCCAESRSS